MVERLGWNRWRRQLLDGLAEAVELLAKAGCKRVWLNGSFVTHKDDPAGVDFEALDPVFFEMDAGRAAQKRRFGGELLPNVTEAASGLSFADFFLHDRDGAPKGVVVVTLGGEP